ncbi:MAG: type VI secretion system baseplate subunit TssG [Fibromonadaceae bacterium]|jgi:hypothetical protein|nr:type VI secretion system baseplate subunit TssG [Fibromonadaceae bacterium]
MGIRNSFFEWMRLWFLSGSENKILHIIGSNSLKHPSGDIDFAKTNEKETLLALNEMSLLGTDSPLPDSIIRDARTDSENALALVNFLNALQHHLAMLRFDVLFEKSNFLMQELGNLKWKNRFSLYNEKFSPEMLRCFFAKLFPDCKISVHCFEPLRIENPAPIFLGKATLSTAMLLGKSCTSLTHAMRVDVCGLSLEQSIELKKKQCFLNAKFPFKININFSVKIHAEVCKLGSKKLSENCWLGSKNLENFKWEKWV